MAPRPIQSSPHFPGLSITLAAVAAVLLSSCASEQGQWYKGNTHAHTTLCGHADSAPEVVAGWYLDHGFNFLILSEHNIFIEPNSVELPADRRDDFILIPGEEITGRKTIHTTGMNIERLIDASFDSEHKSEIIQNHTDGAIAAGGVAILNHPNFGWAVSPKDMLPVERLHMFELYNGHPSVHSHGDANHISTEELWDILLSAGKVIYGVSSDDMHNLKKWGTNVSNPGRGWVMVRADELTPDAITGAMARGDFYASSGVILSKVAVGNPYRNYGGAYYAVTIDVNATMKELESDLLVGNRVSDATEGFTIEWIGQDGVVLSAIHSTSSVRRIEPRMNYMRCKVTYARKIESEAAEGTSGESDTPMYEEFYAWAQPVFTDGRLDRLAPTTRIVRANHTHDSTDHTAADDAAADHQAVDLLNAGHTHQSNR